MINAVNIADIYRHIDAPYHNCEGKNWKSKILVQSDFMFTYINVSICDLQTIVKMFPTVARSNALTWVFYSGGVMKNRQGRQIFEKILQ